MGKNDSWRQPYLYETKKARREKLLGENCRRTGGRLLPVGWMRLKFAGIQQETFSMVQNIYEARVEITARSDHGEIILNTWIANSSNVLVVEIKTIAKKKWEGPRIIIDTVAGDKVLFEEGERYAKQILAE